MPAGRRRGQPRRKWPGGRAEGATLLLTALLPPLPVFALFIVLRKVWLG